MKNKKQIFGTIKTVGAFFAVLALMLSSSCFSPPRQLTSEERPQPVVTLTGVVSQELPDDPGFSPTAGTEDDGTSPSGTLPPSSTVTPQTGESSSQTTASTTEEPSFIPSDDPTPTLETSVLPTPSEVTPTASTPVPTPTPRVAVSGAEFSRNEIALEVGQTAGLLFYVLPANAEDLSFRTEVSDPSVISYDQGIVTALNAGTATVTGVTEDGGFTAMCTVTVTEPLPPTVTPVPFTPFTIGFTGDISFAETYYTHNSPTSSGIYNYAVSKQRSLVDCIDPVMLAEMRRVDFLLVNCESSVSERGESLGKIGKTYTFRTSPKTAEMFEYLGADLIGLANNHVYDFGKDAFLDTLDAFSAMGLPTVGAGRNRAEAYEPYYYTQSGVTVAIIATSRAEKDYYTLIAEEDAPGICGCYDTALVCEKIREAKEKADFVVVYPHYGIEYATDKIEEAQRQASYDFIDAGADLIVGTHAHCLQGIDSYKGKLIFFNLGNFLFNTRTLKTMLLELTFDSPDGYTLRVMPGTQTDGRVLADFDSSAGKETLDYLRKRSYGIAIDKEGYVYDCKYYEREE